jgi:hypothetical protein
MLPALGARVFVRCETLQIECTVKNVKNSWGQPRLLVAPVSGSGEQWVELGRVTVPAASDGLVRRFEAVKGGTRVLRVIRQIKPIEPDTRSYSDIARDGMSE